MKYKFYTLLILCLAFTVLTSSCSLNHKPVDYVKDVVALREGDGFTVYFVLADQSGEPTAVPGSVVLNFETKDYESKEYVPVYTLDLDVKADDFVKAKVGRGPFEHEVVLCSLGRIEDSRIKAEPDAYGRARITFTEDFGGKTVGGETSISF